jgi:hypothetical protein
MRAVVGHFCSLQDNPDLCMPALWTSATINASDPVIGGMDVPAGEISSHWLEPFSGSIQLCNATLFGMFHLLFCGDLLENANFVLSRMTLPN